MIQPTNSISLNVHAPQFNAKNSKPFSHNTPNVLPVTNTTYLGNARVEPFEIKTITYKPVRAKFLRVPYKLGEDISQQEFEMRKSGVW